MLINKIETRTIKYGVIIFKFNKLEKFDNSNITGKRIKHPPAGDGIPSKKLFFHSSVFSNLVKLNLASLSTQQTAKNKTISHPIFPNLFNSQKYTINAGAIPKLTKSVRESNSFPKSEVPLISHATLPSRPSNIAATTKNKIAKVKFPSIANLIELIPKQTPIKVNKLGKIYLDLFTVTTLNLFFFSI